MATVLDAVDAAFGSSPDIARIPGRQLLEFGEEIRRLEQAFSPPPRSDSAIGPSYLGGWPSANVWLGQSAPLVMSSLLYSESAIVRDPITDWFSNYRYRQTQLMGSRSGYLDEHGEAAVSSTRQFLSRTIPALISLRPLIDAEVLRLVPSQRLLWENRREVLDVGSRLMEVINPDPFDISGQFRPRELARADNLRGLFVFSGGDRERQVLRAIEQAVHYFAGEYVLTNVCAGTYAAPYSFEQWLCRDGLDAEVRRSPGGRVLHAVIRSQLPVFGGLTPGLLASVRNDEAFGGFRSELYTTYSSLPESATQEEFDQAMREAEEAVLAPKISEARRSVREGPLSRVLRVLKYPLQIAFSFGVAAAGSEHFVTQGVAQSAITKASALIDRATGRPTGSQAIWARLDRHGQDASHHVDGVIEEAGQLRSMQPYWGIPDEPSMQVHISEGLAIFDSIPRFHIPENPGSHDRPYEPCACGSGLKWKFCCK